MKFKAPHNDTAKKKLLEIIREQRSTIFGAFSSTITNKQKQECWEKIAKEAIALGLIPASKNAKYVRDTYWQNIRRKTIKKIDDSRRTGAAGGEEMVLDDIDNMVIDIVGEIVDN